MNKARKRTSTLDKFLVKVPKQISFAMELKIMMHGFLIYLYAFAPQILCFPGSEEVRDSHDLCTTLRNNHIYNLEENKSLQLILHSSEVNEKLMLRKFKKKCAVTIKSCQACHISIEIQNMTVPSCSGDCSCNHFQIAEPLSDFTSDKYCGVQKQSAYYISRTKTVSLDFVQSVHMKFYVSLTFNAKRNIFIFAEDLSTHPKYIETPYFPMEYPTDYGAEYIFQANYSVGIVQLLFVDFQLSKGSTIEISGHNGTHMIVFNGDDSRPPAITSQGPTLKVRFRANDCPSNIGFRAQYMFGRGTGNNILEKPQTNCGGVKEGFGGAISLTTTSESLFDCIWLIHPPLFAPKYFFLSLYVLNFVGIGSNSTLEIREGPTSKSSLLTVHQCKNQTGCDSPIISSEVITSVESGVYVRFHGYITEKSSVNLSYFIFHKESCSSDEYYCINHRCIKNILLCDGYSNCPDGMDEIHCSDFRGSTIEQDNNTLPSVVKVLSVDKENSSVVAISTVGAFALLAIGLVICMICSNYHIRRECQESQQNPLDETAQQYQNRNSHHRFNNLYNLYENSDMPPSYNEVLIYNYRYPPITYSHRRYWSAMELVPMLHDEVVPAFHQECNSTSLKRFCTSVENLSLAGGNKVAAEPLSKSFSVDLKKCEMSNDFRVYINRSSSLPAKLDTHTTREIFE